MLKKGKGLGFAKERATVRNATLDLASGLLVLPVGKDHGVESDRILSVQSLNREICKIKITQANLRNSVAHIIPLLDEPDKLLNPAV